jgi:hypothetical protein
VPWLRPLVTELSPQRTRFIPGSVYVGFVVNKVALGQVFLRVLLFFPVNIIPLRLSIFIYHLGETYSRATDRKMGMNMIVIYSDLLA